MADGFVGADAVGLYWTGSDASDGLRHAEAVVRRPALFFQDIPNVIVEQVAGRTAIGQGIIQATDADTLAYRAPGDSVYGAGVAVAAGETKVLEGDTDGTWVRVTRINSENMGGFMTVDTQPSRAVTVPESGRASGFTLFRQFILHNHSLLSVENLKVYVGTLGDSGVSDGGQLSASGAGSVVTTGDLDALGWPAQGWCRIETSGGTLREIVFYTSRTATTLTVPAAGRALLGSTAAAGASDDVIYPVPGMRVATEAADAEGTIQAASGTEIVSGLWSGVPSGVVPTSGITAGTGASGGTVGAMGNCGVWVTLEFPVDIVSGTTGLEYVLRWSWDYDGTTYWDEYRWEHPVAETALAVHRVHVGEDAVPDWDGTPDGSGASYPVNVSVALPGSGTKTINVTCRDQNAHGLIGLNTRYQTVVIDSSGNDVTPDLSDLLDVTLTNIAGGEVDLVASYDLGKDASPGDYARLYVTTDGTDPDPATDTPVDIALGVSNGLSANAVVEHVLGPYAYGTDVRVIARAYRSGDTTESGSTTVLQATVNTEAPAGVHGGGVYHGKAAGRVRTAADFSLETIVDVTHNVRFVREPGLTEFWVGSTLIWRAMWPSANRARIWIPDALDLKNTTISGSAGAEPVDVVSATEIYLAAGGDRQVKIDLTAGTVESATFELWGTPTDQTKKAAYYVGASAAAFQVFDVENGRWRPYVEVTSGGTLRAAVPVTQRSA
jgi:hypothetical protein